MRKVNISQFLLTFPELAVNFMCQLLTYAESSAFLDIYFCVYLTFLLYEKFKNSTSSFSQLLNLLKIEAIQIFLFVDVLVIVFISNVSTSKSKSISR